MDTLIDILTFLPRGLIYVALGVAILVLATLAREIVTRHKLEEEIVTKKNTAVALRLTGYLLGVIIVFVGAVFQPQQWDANPNTGLGIDRAFGMQLLWTFAYAMAGVVALNLVRPLTDRLVLYKFQVEKEIVEDQNVGVAAAEFGINVAAGLAIAGAIAGYGSPLNALAFFGLGLTALILFALFYEWTTPFNIHDEIESGNPAIGIALGGNLVAIGLVIFKASFGDFFGWTTSLIEFGVFAIFGFAMLYLIRLAVDTLILPKTKTSEALAAGRNIGVAIVESTVAISSALILLVVI